MEGIVERRPELVGSDYGAAICSARPELEEEDVRRRQSAAKVRWSVEEEELRVWAARAAAGAEHHHPGGGGAAEEAGAGAGAGSKGGVDVFGQTHPAIAADVIKCMNCGRPVVACRFAPHLEKCMGKVNQYPPLLPDTLDPHYLTSSPFCS